MKLQKPFCYLVEFWIVSEIIVAYIPCISQLHPSALSKTNCRRNSSWCDSDNEDPTAVRNHWSFPSTLSVSAVTHACYLSRYSLYSSNPHITHYTVLTKKRVSFLAKSSLHFELKWWLIFCMLKKCTQGKHGHKKHKGQRGKRKRKYGYSLPLFLSGFFIPISAFYPSPNLLSIQPSIQIKTLFAENRKDAVEPGGRAEQRLLFQNGFK